MFVIPRLGLFITLFTILSSSTLADDFHLRRSGKSVERLQTRQITNSSNVATNFTATSTPTSTTADTATAAAPTSITDILQQMVTNLQTPFATLSSLLNTTNSTAELESNPLYTQALNQTAIAFQTVINNLAALTPSEAAAAKRLLLKRQGTGGLSGAQSQAVVQNLLGSLDSVVNLISAHSNNLDILGSMFNDVFTTIQPDLKSLFSDLTSLVTTVTGAAEDILGGVAGGLLGGLSGPSGLVGGVVGGLTSGLLGGL